MFHVSSALIPLCKCLISAIPTSDKEMFPIWKYFKI